MDQSLKAWTILSNINGEFKGIGLNHEGEKFTGHLKIKVALPEKLIHLESTATITLASLLTNLHA